MCLCVRVRVRLRLYLCVLMSERVCLFVHVSVRVGL